MAVMRGTVLSVEEISSNAEMDLVLVSALASFTKVSLGKTLVLLSIKYIGMCFSQHNKTYYIIIGYPSPPLPKNLETC